VIQVNTPDGVANFPDGTSPEVIKAALRKRFPAAGTPDGADTEGLVSDLPGGGYTARDAFVGPMPDEETQRTAGVPQAYKNLADLPLGMAKSLGRNLLGAAKLSPFSLTAQAMGGPDPTGDVLEQGREALAPSTQGEERAAEIEKLLEFFVPGPGKASGLLGTMAKSALEAGVVGSAQEGRPDPDAAVAGAVGGGVGHAVGGAAAGLAERLPKSALKTLMRLIKPDVGFDRDKTARAAVAALEEGSVAGAHGPEALVERAAARSARLKEPRDAYRATTDAKWIDPVQLAQPLIEEAQQYVRKAPDGTPFFTNRLKFDQLMAQANEIMSARGKVEIGPVNAKLGDMEDMLQGASNQGKVYDRLDPTKAPAEEGVRLMRDELNVASPGRAPAMEPYSDALAFEENLRKAMGRAELREPSQAGQQFATRGVIGTAIGGGSGAAAAVAAEGAVQVGRFLNSPTFRALSAQQKQNLGKRLASLHPSIAQVVEDSLSASVGADQSDDSGVSQEAIRYLMSKLNLKTPEAPQ
jgi:hypothetical protein